MPWELYLVRRIHHATRRAFPGERLWTATQLMNLATVRFLRVRNREGCDVYIQPYAGDHNAGYILVDLDHASPTVLEAMRAHGHELCVVLQTSPAANLQAWIHVSRTPLEPAVATPLGRPLGLHLWRRPGQHRLATLGKAGWLRPSKARAPAGQRPAFLGESRACPAGAGTPC